MLDRKAFFDTIRPKLFLRGMFQSQVEGLTNILDEWERRALSDPRQLAYMLATVFHETSTSMQPIVEFGSVEYLRSKPYYPWIGRGLVQITWQVNYAKFGITRAEDALEWPTALRVLFEGMLKGMFTAKRLADYFDATHDDPVGARHIVNGSDQAVLISGYHADFLEAIKAASKPAPVIATTFAPPHIVPPPAPAPSLWSRFTSLFIKKAA